MKWVKVSERLPPKSGKYFTRYRNYNGEQRTASLFNGWSFPHHVSEVEWLDETELDETELLRDKLNIAMRAFTEILNDETESKTAAGGAMLIITYDKSKPIDPETKEWAMKIIEEHKQSLLTNEAEDEGCDARMPLNEPNDDTIK